MTVSTLETYGDRKTSSIFHYHDLRTFSPLSISAQRASFITGTKVSSMKLSFKSRAQRSFKPMAITFRIGSIVRFRFHDWSLQGKVCFGGYRSGKYCQGFSVRRIHITPLNTSAIISRSSRTSLCIRLFTIAWVLTVILLLIIGLRNLWFPPVTICMELCTWVSVSLDVDGITCCNGGTCQNHVC
jgi:hypothetical protein